ncbi:MAG TPA: hypothetical protein VGK34_01475 [Armatimonadota bacterium]
MNRIKRMPPVSGTGKIKDPSITKDRSDEDAHPVFSMIYVDDRYCITNCEAKDKVSFVNKLRMLSKLPWSDLRGGNKHGSSCEVIRRETLRVKVPPHITDDVTILAFRYSGKKAMVGYRDNATFHIVWFDDDYNVYNHGH